MYQLNHVFYPGAALFSENDDWFNALQGFIADPEAMVTALGATRVKRDANYDQESDILNTRLFNIEHSYLYIGNEYV